MKLLTLAAFCLSCGISLAQSDSGYVHKFLDDGDKIEPEISFHSQKYTKNQHRKWSLHAEHGVWALVFQKFSLELSTNCEHDYVQVEELNNGSEPVRPVRYCGENIPRPYVSTRPRLEIVFVSDNIWEMEGFLIQVIHSDDPDALKEKMNPYIGKAEQNQVKSRDKGTTQKNQSDVSQHPLFFTLIGCSIAALVIFGILLAYFVISIRKREAKLQTRAPDAFYIRPSEIIAENRRPDIVPMSGPRPVVCTVGKAGKRYSKDSKGNTARKTMASNQKRAQHNNLYVSGNLSGKG